MLGVCVFLKKKFTKTIATKPFRMLPRFNNMTFITQNSQQEVEGLILFNSVCLRPYFRNWGPEFLPPPTLIKTNPDMNSDCFLFLPLQCSRYKIDICKYFYHLKLSIIMAVLIYMLNKEVLITH